MDYRNNPIVTRRVEGQYSPRKVSYVRLYETGTSPRFFVNMSEYTSHEECLRSGKEGVPYVIGKKIDNVYFQYVDGQLYEVSVIEY